MERDTEGEGGDSQETEVRSARVRPTETIVFADTRTLGGPFYNKFVNPDGSPRGGISVHAEVADTAHVDTEAAVLAGAKIGGEAKVVGRSVIGAGVVIDGYARVVNSEVVAASPQRPDARTVIRDYAVVENYHLVGRSVVIASDAWVAGRFEGRVKLGGNTFKDVSGGYHTGELVDGVTYAGSFSGTGKADMLTTDGVTALKRFLLSLPVDMRERYLEELDVIEEATGVELADSDMEQPISRMVLGADGKRYVVALSEGDLARVEDLLRSGASFPEVANIYDIQQESLLFALTDRLGYNVFANWEEFIQRPMRTEFSVALPENHRSLMFRRWRAVDPTQQAIWEGELADTSRGLLYEMDDLPDIRHYSTLDRPNITFFNND